MTDVTELRMTNLRIPPYVIREPRWKHGEVRVFNDKLILSPVHDEAILDMMQTNRRRAMNTVSVIAHFDPTLVDLIAAQAGKLVTVEDIALQTIHLLSFATRRGVGFKSPPQWRRKGKLVVRGGVYTDALLNTVNEYRTLLENGLPKLLSEEYQERRLVSVALLWFLGWRDENTIEMQYVRQFIALEMMAKAHHRLHSTEAIKDVAKIKKFIGDVGADSSIPVELYAKCRNSIVHGDVLQARQDMAIDFGQYVKPWREEMEALLGNSPHLPNPNHYNDALSKANALLSTVMENVFMKLLGVAHDVT